jgi:hypothetical protein
LLKRKVIGIVLLFILSGLVSSTFTIQHVRADTITVPDNYLTIQEAVNHASEGDTINVRNGTYAGGIITNKSLTLVGVNKIDTVIEQLNISELGDIYLTNLCVNNLDVRNSTSVWALGCRFQEASVDSNARLLMCQSEAWEVHTYNKGEILGFYDMPLFGRVVFAYPFGLVYYALAFLTLVVVLVAVLIYVRQKKKQPSKAEHAEKL